MEYKQKYLKYKNKYLELKSTLYGGEYIDSLREFLMKYYKSFYSELIFILKKKFKKEINYENKEIVEEFIEFCIPQIITLMEFFYDKLTQESKDKPNICIFSYATSSAFIEALFGLYLRERHGKTVNLLYCDVDQYNHELIGEYKIFDKILNLYRLINYDIRLKIKPSEIHKKIATFEQFYKKYFNFDIFISSDPQNYVYDINDSSKIHLILIYLYILLIKRGDLNIPMLWIISDDSVDFSDKFTLEESIINAFRKYPKYDITPIYSISIIENINKIFKIPKEVFLSS